MSSTKSKNQVIFTILKSLPAEDFRSLVREYFKTTSLIPEGKHFTILIPRPKEITRLGMMTDDKKYVKYIIKSHFIPQDIRTLTSKNAKIKTSTGNFDLTLISNSNGKIHLEDSNHNQINLTLANNRKTLNIKNVSYSVYYITSGTIECNKKGIKTKVGKSKKVHGGSNVHGDINTCRLLIHKNLYSKFETYLCDRENCINPYGPSCAGLLRMLDVKGYDTECKKVAYLMTHCSFALFYILVQPFKTVGDYIIPDNIISEWGGKEYYPSDICGFYCNFVSKHLPDIYNNENLLNEINSIRLQFKPNLDYNEWLNAAYKEFKYPNSVANLGFNPMEKYFYDELKFKLCNIYCNIMKHENNNSNVLLYNMQILELLFPCNDEMSEAKFTDPTYKEFITREELLAPGSIYKFVYSTDFLSMFISLDLIKKYENITNNSKDITLNNKKIFNSEQFRCDELNKDSAKIREIHDYNKSLYN